MPLPDRDSKRYYPYSTMASQVIGFVNKANEGAYGLEALYNLDLAGQDGKIITAKNASGTEMPSAYSSYTDAWTATTSTPPLTPPSRCTQRRRWRRAFKSLMSPTAASAW